MPWIRDSLATLIKRNQGDIESSLPGVNAKLRRTNLNVIGKIISLTAHGLYGAFAWGMKQRFPRTADTDYLDQHASFWLKEPRKAATYAAGSVIIAGIDNTLIQTGETLIRQDGIEYVIAAEATIIGGMATVQATCLIPGQIGNATPGTILTTGTTVSGVTSITVDTGISGGTDEESNESVNQRIENRVQNPPHGGSKHDYVTWAEEVPGVTRAWHFDNEQGAGTMVVRFVRDNDENIIPDANEVATVQAYIDAVRPAGMKGFYAVAPIPTETYFDIELTPNTEATRQAVQNELDDLYARQAKPGASIKISHIREAVSIAAGETDHIIHQPTDNVAHSNAQMPMRGPITWR